MTLRQRLFTCFRPQFTAYRHLSRVALVLCVAHCAVLFDDHGPTTVPVAHTSVPPVVLAEELCGILLAYHATSPKDLHPIQTYRLAIAHELELAVRLHTIDLAPRAHHKRIVGGDDHHHVHTLVRNLVQVLNVRRDVEGLAAGREGAWDGHDHHLLALELFGCLEGGRHRAGLGIVVLDRGVGKDYALGELVAGFERGHGD